MFLICLLYTFLLNFFILHCLRLLFPLFISLWAGDRMTNYLTWMVSFLSELVRWLYSMEFTQGISILGFMGALFVLHLVIDNFLIRG